MKFLIVIWAFRVASSALASDLPYDDADFGCTPAADADRYFKDFHVDIASFGGPELCDPTKDTKKLLDDLSLVERTQFGADRAHFFLQGIVPADSYYRWMSSQTLGMQRGTDNPTATAYNKQGRFTMQDAWTALSTLGRVGTITHEARHSAGFPHVECTSGPYLNSGLSACDSSLSEKGAFAVEMEYYARAALDAQNLSPVYQSMARLMAVGRANIMLNKHPLRVREGLLGRAGNQLVLADGDAVVVRDGPAAAPDARLRRSAAGASLVTAQSAQALDLYDPNKLGATLSDDYSYFKLFKSHKAQTLSGIVDAREWDSGDQRYFAVMNATGEVAAYNFEKGEWFPADAAQPGTRAFTQVAPNGRTGLFAVNASGAVTAYYPDLHMFGFPFEERWPEHALAFGHLGAKLVELTSEGAIVDAGSGQGIASLSGYHFSEMIDVPLYDAFEIVK